MDISVIKVMFICKSPALQVGASVKLSRFGMNLTQNQFNLKHNLVCLKMIKNGLKNRGLNLFKRALIF